MTFYGFSSPLPVYQALPERSRLLWWITRTFLERPCDRDNLLARTVPLMRVVHRPIVVVSGCDCPDTMPDHALLCEPRRCEHAHAKVPPGKGGKTTKQNTKTDPTMIPSTNSTHDSRRFRDDRLLIRVYVRYLSLLWNALTHKILF